MKFWKVLIFIYFTIFTTNFFIYKILVNLKLFKAWNYLSLLIFFRFCFFKSFLRLYIDLLFFGLNLLGMVCGSIILFSLLQNRLVGGREASCKRKKASFLRRLILSFSAFLYYRTVFFDLNRRIVESQTRLVQQRSQILSTFVMAWLYEHSLWFLSSLLTFLTRYNYCFFEVVIQLLFFFVTILLNVNINLTVGCHLRDLFVFFYWLRLSVTHLFLFLLKLSLFCFFCLSLKQFDWGDSLLIQWFLVIVSRWWLGPLSVLVQLLQLFRQFWCLFLA